MMFDWPAWMVAGLTLLLPLLIKPVRENRFVLVTIYCIVIARQILAVIGSYISPVKGAENDALAFHRAAAKLAESGEYYFGIGADFYENFLGIIYALFGTSRLLGSETSILAFLLSVFLFFAAINRFGQDRHGIALVLIYSMLPAMLVMTSTTLREAWQLLFFVGSVYWGLRYREDNSPYSFALMVLFALAMALFHKVLILYTVILIPLFYLWPRNGQSSYHEPWARTSAILALFALIVVLGFWFIAEFIGTDYGGEVISALMRGELLEYISHYHSVLNAQAGRAGYEILLDTSSWVTLIQTWFIVYLQYLFSPFPWQLQNLVDAYAFVEVVMRVLLLTLSFYVSLRAMRDKRYDGLLLVFLYLLMTALWSIGTANYGQAIRHHLLTNWILFLVAGPFLFGAIAQVWGRARKS